MSPRIHHAPAHTHQPPFWRSRTGFALTVFLGFAGVFLGVEHWAHVAGVVPLLLPVLICLGMHLFMHGGHGHGGHDGASGRE